MNPMERIACGLNGLTKTERAVASYFLENPVEVADSTIASVSQKTGFSRTAIMRTCKAVGYSGYAELRFSIGKHISAHGGAGAADAAGPYGRSLRNLADTYGVYLHKVANIIDADQLKAMARTICGAKRISIWGVNRTHEGVMQLSNRLMRLGVFNQASSDIITMADIARILGEGDLCIVFSMNGRGTDYAPLMDSISSRGAAVFLITMNPGLDLIAHASQAVVLPWISRDYEFGTLEDQIIVFMYLDILLAEVARQLEEGSAPKSR